MKIELKGIDVSGDYLSDRKPDNVEFFNLWITIKVGEVGEDEGVLYQVQICTPEWLKYAIKYEEECSAFWGRHMLIVDTFDAKVIENLVSSKIDEVCSMFPNDSVEKLLEKLGRYAHWEFEDYVPYD